MLLQAGDLEVGIDFLIGLDEVALRLQPFQRAAQIVNPLAAATSVFEAGLFIPIPPLAASGTDVMPAAA